MEKKQLQAEKLPRHIAIIMDGNGRWAQQRHLPRIMGHRKGIEAVREVVRECRQLGIGVLTLYAFSTENWRRPKAEIRALMALLKKFIRSEMLELHQNNIRVTMIGDLSKLPGDVMPAVREIMDVTAHNTGMTLNVALSYSGRDDILRAVRRLVAERGRKAAEITEELFSSCLDTAGQPDPDLLIRTSGELRVSNFLLWQIAYSELYITDVLWPDFGKKDLAKALRDYQTRRRRFGLTDEQMRTG
ncbi:MAG: isoprenyl transferase [Deltaproteobacteria bacterium]|nr:isoprenyl transferase [Deltaproteobacteria bacterium]